ncbi:hypothetical protein ASPWEDRAFT_60029 [Aspergillus wentii DTO 134E9]|uniref:Uncharacterized protein n=1 Tax=Aspergillus wentii DTO 134E9 TaxID=1073089 RepID=A0A1L9RLZ5_ASPWE|nr:uncharacterized protein ASPWEDRAFT_60029 [Aspergillus wentii DTO 134E9]OJJ35838.1 hypothetical protein ASPWEDRAFT_60029 [Aspergillus wentii DTO 134E9]
MQLPRMSSTAAFVFLETLWEAGVSHVFVVFGFDNPSILGAIGVGQKTRPDRFPKIVTCPTEFVAVSMADGFSRLTGKMQAIFVRGDVGTEELGAAMHNASIGRVPVLVFAELSSIALNGETAGFRSDYKQYIPDLPDQRQIASQYCRYTEQITKGKNIRQFVNRGIQFANSEPKGPVYLTAAREILADEVESIPSLSLKVSVSPSPLSDFGVEMIANHLVYADEPLIITSYSGRNPEAVSNLIALADTVKHLHVLSMGGSEMSFPANHPASLGTRWGAHPAVATADVILVLDCDVPWVSTQCRPSGSAKIFHIDIDPLKPQMTLCDIPSLATFRADSAMSFKQLNRCINNCALMKSQIAQTMSYRDGFYRYRRLSNEHIPVYGPRDPLNAFHLIKEVRKFCPEDTIWAVEAATLSSIVANQVAATHPKSWFTCGGGHGWSGGGALGIKLATDFLRGGKGKGKFVCQIVGDGGYMSSIPSSVYWISHRYGIPVLTIMLNNERWAAPRPAPLAVQSNGYGSRMISKKLGASSQQSPNYPGIAAAASGGSIWAGCASTVAELA